MKNKRKILSCILCVALAVLLGVCAVCLSSCQIMLVGEYSLTVVDGVLTGINTEGAGKLCVTVPEGVTEIGDGAFKNCERLVEITLPDGLTRIGKGAFEGCKRLRAVFLPESLTYIGARAFFNCKKLNDAVIPENLQYMERSSFAGCKGVIEYENGVYYVGNWAVDSYKWSNIVVVRDGTVGVAGYAFSDRRRNMEVLLPDGLRYICAYSFFGTDVAEITVPESVVEIGARAFSRIYKMHAAPGIWDLKKDGVTVKTLSVQTENDLKEMIYLLVLDPHKWQKVEASE